MAFELYLSDSTPVTGEKNADVAVIRFLQQIGYISKKYQKKDIETIKKGVGYRLFAECFLSHSNKIWRVEELSAVLSTSVPTVYRHLNKLRSIDLLEEMNTETEGGSMKKGYRIRYGNLSKSWNFPEAHIRLALENYRKSVDYIHKISKEGLK